MTAAAPAAAAPAAPKKSKKKLILIVVVLLLLAGIGLGTVVFLKKRAAAAAAAEDGDAPAQVEKTAHHDEHKPPPQFVPMDPFVVNLADHDVDRYAQIGVTLEVPDAHVSEDIKTYLPAIRNNVLMLIAHKASTDLQGREGKELLAREIRGEALRAMGYDLAAEEAKAKAKLKGKHKAEAEDEHPLPITSVQFSSFIIQ